MNWRGVTGQSRRQAGRARLNLTPPLRGPVL